MMEADRVKIEVHDCRVGRRLENVWIQCRPGERATGLKDFAHTASIAERRDQQQQARRVG